MENKEIAQWKNTKSYPNLYFCSYCGDGPYTVKEIKVIDQCPHCKSKIIHR